MGSEEWPERPERQRRLAKLPSTQCGRSRLNEGGAHRTEGANSERRERDKGSLQKLLTLRSALDKVLFPVLLLN